MTSHFGEFVLLNIDLKVNAIILFYFIFKIRFETVISIFQKGPWIIIFPFFGKKAIRRDLVNFLKIPKIRTQFFFVFGSSSL
jgi:hypothetical protein